MSKKIVAYFSATGTTAKVAKKIAAATGAELYEIVPAEPYTAADLDWENERSRSSIEMKDEASPRPKLAKDSAGTVAPFDVVFLGFPIWWDREPAVVDAFLAQNDFSGKTIVVFATSGSSGLENSAAVLKSKVAPSAKIVRGKVLNGNPSAKTVAAWVESLGL